LFCFQLQTRLREVNEDLARREDMLATTATEVEKYKRIFEAHEQEKSRLERKLEDAVHARNRMESKIVLNPDALQTVHKHESEKV